MPSCTLYRIIVDPGYINMKKGSARLLSATGYDKIGNPQHDTAMTWSSANTAIATVSAAGVVTAVKEGKTAIIATSGSISGGMQIQIDG